MTPGSAVRHDSAVRHAIDCAMWPGTHNLCMSAWTFQTSTPMLPTLICRYIADVHMQIVIVTSKRFTSMSVSLSTEPLWIFEVWDEQEIINSYFTNLIMIGLDVMYIYWECKYSLSLI